MDQGKRMGWGEEPQTVAVGGVTLVCEKGIRGKNLSPKRGRPGKPPEREDTDQGRSPLEEGREERGQRKPGVRKEPEWMEVE